MKAINLEFIDAPLWYHTRGLQQTASGYGKKLKTPYKALTNGRAYRVYCCIFSNSGTLYIVIKGENITVDRYD
jgi:hypothetical protein